MIRKIKPGPWQVRCNVDGQAMKEIRDWAGMHSMTFGDGVRELLGMGIWLAKRRGLMKRP